MNKSIFFLLSLFYSSLYAVNLFSKNNIFDTQIDADQGMTCNQEGSVCWAKGNIRVTRGTSVLTCNKLQVQFTRNHLTHTNQISMIKAWQRVKIKDLTKEYLAQGEYCEYNHLTHQVRLEGHPSFSHPKLSVTNATILTFDQSKKKVTALGKGIIIKEENLLQANELIAYFHSIPLHQHSLIFDHLSAKGDVLISTPTEIAHCQNGHYDVSSEKAELWGKVVITRPNGQSRGEHAIIDMKSGTSQMMDDLGIFQRTQILLIPKNKQHKNKD